MKNNQYPGGFKLTLKKARELALQEFGTAKSLAADPNAMPGYFIMKIGNLHIRISPDIYGSGCIVIRAGMCGGTGTCIQYHDPETLKENFDVEEQQSRRDRQDNLEQWVYDLGLEAAHTAVDRIWNNQ